jgi:hypothetical protein
MSPDLLARVQCFVDVDEKKIKCGFYYSQHHQLPDPAGVAGTSIGITGGSGGGSRGEGSGNAATLEGGAGAGSNTAGKEHPPNTNAIGERNAKRAKIDRKKGLKVPIYHFTKLTRPTIDMAAANGDANAAGGATAAPSTEFARLPVVVCVAMYRTDGILEANVRSIGRVEGEDLWHFS